MNSAKAKTKIKKLRTHSGNGSAWLTRQEKKIFPIFPFSMWKNRNFLCLPQKMSPYYIISTISGMLDLSEYSNTDLKLAYGVGNFKVLCEYDENFNHFLLALTNLARACTEAGLYSEAEQTFLLAFHYGSQKMTDYTSLADIYLHLEEPEKISALIRNVEDGSLPHKEALIQALEQKLMTYR